ncbi:MAG: response regulator transcription factor [Acidobacteria bacterium]|nr:response regulator transcription factor [Acidobacteriota bacterium]
MGSEISVNESIRVLALDNTRIHTQLLVEALSRQGLDVREVVADASEILATVTRERPHVVLLTSQLQNSSENGFEIARKLNMRVPETKVVMLLDSSHRTLVTQAFRSGARGVFSRSGSVEALLKCIERVHMGQVWANSKELGFLIEAFSETPPALTPAHGTLGNLSQREQDVVWCVADGLTNREIAAHLKLTEHTVKNYLSRVFEKTGVSSRVELALSAATLKKPRVRETTEGEPGTRQVPPTSNVRTGRIA